MTIENDQPTLSALDHFSFLALPSRAANQYFGKIGEMQIEIVLKKIGGLE